MTTPPKEFFDSLIGGPQPSDFHSETGGVCIGFSRLAQQGSDCRKNCRRERAREHRYAGSREKLHGARFRNFALKTPAGNSASCAFLFDSLKQTDFAVCSFFFHTFVRKGGYTQSVDSKRRKMRCEGGAQGSAYVSLATACFIVPFSGGCMRRVFVMHVCRNRFPPSSRATNRFTAMPCLSRAAFLQVAALFPAFCKKKVRISLFVFLDKAVCGY